MIIQPRLKELMQEKGLNQSSLSELSGVPQGTISRFDKNTRHEARHLFFISKALGVKIEELFKVIED